MTLQDLANYTAIEREPLSITYRNTKIFSTVAPSSGSVVLSALKVSMSPNVQTQSYADTLTHRSSRVMAEVRHCRDKRDSMNLRTI